MCGHGIIGLVKAGLEHGLFAPRDPEAIRIDTPAGRVVARAHRRGERVERVSFRNVPSFVVVDRVVVDVAGLGRVHGALAFGGAFYFYTDAAPLGLALVPSDAAALIDAGMRIKRAFTGAHACVHPTGGADLGFLYGTIFVGPAAAGGHSRNVCIFADGELDRSPTGTGVSGRAAIHHARGELAVGETITIESILGTTFDVRIIETTTVGSVPAVVPEVSGEAWVTGKHEFVLDARDPLRDGFLLR
jgi:trans-L-3-hydroxyproline dehydratase